MRSPKKITAHEYEYLTRDYAGLCLECHEIDEDGVEPDAEGYECPSCEAHAVMGLETAFIMGHLTVIFAEGDKK